MSLSTGISLNSQVVYFAPMNALQTFPIGFVEDRDLIVRFLQWKLQEYAFNLQATNSEVRVTFDFSGMSATKIWHLDSLVGKLRKACHHISYYDIAELNKVRPNKGSASDKDWEIHIPKVGGKPNYRWNHDSINFPEAIAKISAPQTNGRRQLDPDLGPAATGIRVFQFDTGYSKHDDILSNPGYITPQKPGGNTLIKSFAKESVVPHDELRYYFLASGGFQRPGHGTATAFTMMGKEGLPRNQWPVKPTGFNQLRGTWKEPLAAGLFPYAEFVPCKVSETVTLGGGAAGTLLPEVGDSKSLIPALDHAIANKADVITMSMGGSLFPRKVRKAYEAAYKKGVIMVCAAGNSKKADKVFNVVSPANYLYTICAAGIEPRMQGGKLKYIKWNQSCDGPETDISAPARYIYTALALDPKRIEDPALRAELGDGHLYKFGGATSQATVHVASAAALWKFHYQDLLKQEPYVSEPWKIVEAFRFALYYSRDVPDHWSFNTIQEYKGILDVEAMLDDRCAPDAPYTHMFLDEVRRRGKRQRFQLYRRLRNRNDVRK